MLLFFDESYERLSATEVLHVYAGFGISENKYRHLIARVHQLKQEFFLSSDNKSRDERDAQWKTHFLVRGVPEHAELKAVDLLSMTSLLHKQNVGFSAGFELSQRVLQVVRETGGTTFGVISFPRSIQSIQHDAPSLPLYLIAVLERVNLWMEEVFPTEQAVLVLDTVNSRTNPVISRHFTEYLLKSGTGKRMRNLVPTPFWVDSRTSVGSQAADLIAHVLMNSSREAPHRKEGLRPLWQEIMQMEFRSYNGSTHGVRKMRRQGTLLRKERQA